VICEAFQEAFFGQSTHVLSPCLVAILLLYLVSVGWVVPWDPSLVCDLDHPNVHLVLVLLFDQSLAEALVYHLADLFLAHQNQLILAENPFLVVPRKGLFLHLTFCSRLQNVHLEGGLFYPRQTPRHGSHVHLFDHLVTICFCWVLTLQNQGQQQQAGHQLFGHPFSRHCVSHLSAL